MLKARYAALRETMHEALAESEDDDHSTLAGRVHDTKDQSLSDLLFGVDLAIVNMHLGELADTEAALERLANGDFGRCADCGDDIDANRLLAYPTARRCLGCQEAREAREHTR
ncbi:MAG: TraR/DksA family transcriptional regulator [Burkholderiaceae bacterium]